VFFPPANPRVSPLPADAVAAAWYWCLAAISTVPHVPLSVQPGGLVDLSCLTMPPSCVVREGTSSPETVHGWIVAV
jgi:hypothetical protein